VPFNEVCPTLVGVSRSNYTVIRPYNGLSYTCGNESVKDILKNFARLFVPRAWE